MPGVPPWGPSEGEQGFESGGHCCAAFGGQRPWEWAREALGQAEQREGGRNHAGRKKVSLDNSHTQCHI